MRLRNSFICKVLGSGLCLILGALSILSCNKVEVESQESVGVLKYQPFGLGYSEANAQQFFNKGVMSLAQGKFDFKGFGVGSNLQAILFKRFDEKNSISISGIPSSFDLDNPYYFVDAGITELENGGIVLLPKWSDSLLRYFQFNEDLELVNSIARDLTQDVIPFKYITYSASIACSDGNNGIYLFTKISKYDSLWQSVYWSNAYLFQINHLHEVVRKVRLPSLDINFNQGKILFANNVLVFFNEIEKYCTGFNVAQLFNGYLNSPILNELQYPVNVCQFGDTLWIAGWDQLGSNNYAKALKIKMLNMKSGSIYWEKLVELSELQEVNSIAMQSNQGKLGVAYMAKSEGKFLYLSDLGELIFSANIKGERAGATVNNIGFVANNAFIYGGSARINGNKNNCFEYQINLP